MCLLILVHFVKAQTFISPVKHAIKLAGTFGELRSNHFHMGIDIKSEHRASGDPILAVQAGYVSRIKVSRSGYGNALYINHPSGHTTVYGHLRNYSERIDSFVSKVQNEKESFEIDIDLNPTDLPVEQAEIIGNMGNSGNSYGPHLHFEIRDTESEAPLNPMKFGFKPQDTTAPLIREVKIVGLDDKLNEINEKVLKPSSTSKGQYRLPDQKIGAWRIGLAVNTYDPMNSGYNKNGVYRIELLEDGVSRYEASFDSISYADTKYINAHIDYKHYKKKKARFHRCFVLEGNLLPIYSDSSAIINLFQNQAKTIKIIIADYEGNTSELSFKVFRDSIMSVPPPIVFNYLLSHDEANLISYNNVQLDFPDSSLYRDEALYISSSPGDYVTDVIHIGSESTPLHRPMKAYFKVDSSLLTDTLIQKLCVVECSQPSLLRSYGGYLEEDFFTARLFSFGNYTLAFDTLSPMITPLKLGEGGRLQFRIVDNFSDSGDAKGLRYTATVDGIWAKFSYDLKTNKITHKLQIPRSGTDHIVRLKVTDDRDNTSVFEKKFVW